MTLVRNETQRHSEALKSAGQNPISLLPLSGYSFAVLSLQLRPVFGAVSSRVPPGSASSRFVDFGDKSWDNFKNFFQTQCFEFLFLSQRARRTAFGGSISPKTPVLKLNRPLSCKPPASTASESALVVFEPSAKPQVNIFGNKVYYYQQRTCYTAGKNLTRRYNTNYKEGYEKVQCVVTYAKHGGKYYADGELVRKKKTKIYEDYKEGYRWSNN